MVRGKLSERVSGRDPAVRRARWIAEVFDRVGFVDPILGFILPGAGDFASSAVGLYIVGVAVQKRLHPVIIARMLVNLAIDALLGSIPLVGDVFDIFHKAHARNVQLLEARHGGRRATGVDWLYVVGAGLAFLVAVTLPFLILVWALMAIF